jgi:glycosyltransferase involved in cell wall biosynthesis
MARGGSALRVMHVLASFESGGIQKSLIDLIDRLPNVDMSVAAVVAGGDYQAQFKARCRTILFCHRGTGDIGSYQWFHPARIINLAHEMRDIQPSIVQTHTFSAAVVGRAAAKLSGVPVIIDTLHNTYYWKGAQELRIDRWLARFTDCIVCVSQSVRDYAIIQNPNIASSKYRIVYNGIDTRRYRPRENSEKLRTRFGIRQGELVVGSVSRLVEQKRICDLIAAAHGVLQRFPHVRFLVVGDGPTAGQLITDVHSRGLESHFIFTGRLHDAENVYPACDVFTQLAEREGFGLSMTEAMASGTAVVAASVGAIPEIVQHGRNGLLYRARDIQGLTDSICALLDDVDLRSALGRQAASDIEARFNIEAVPPQYYVLWDRLLSEATGAKPRHR